MPRNTVSRMSSPLLVRVILTLAATGLLPLVIAFFLLRVNRDALLDQLLKTHLTVVTAAADQVEAQVEPLRTAARALAENPRIREGRTQAAQELLVAMLQIHPRIALLGVYNPAGEAVLEVRQRGARPEIGQDAVPADAEPVELLAGADGRRWLRVVEPIRDESGTDAIGWIIFVAGIDAIETVVKKDRQLGREARVVVADASGTVLFGDLPDLGYFPDEAVRAAMTRKTAAGANNYKGPGEDVMVAHAAIAGTPWIVLTRQPASEAEKARQASLRGAWIAAGLSLGLTAVFSHLAFLTVIRPLRRLARAQQDLLGGGVAAAGGSEITQLEAAFELLEQRVRDREDIDKVFLGRYQVIDVLGAGAMGTVFKGFDPKLERDLALKTIRLETADARREKLVATLLREATTSAKFNHPNIVTVYDVADEGRAAFIAMELVDGISLEELVDARGRLDWREAVSVGAAVARGLAAAHRRDLVHQDVKPANVLLGRDDSIKVTDFGISQLISAASAERDVICGTPGYIAPECLEGEGYSPRSDLFALGVLLHECLSGDHPFAGKTLRVTILNTITQDPPALDRLHPDLPPELSTLITRLLDKDPRRRPREAEEVARQLDELALEVGIEWHWPTFPVSPDARGTRRLSPSGRIVGTATRLLSLRETREIARRA